MKSTCRLGTQPQPANTSQRVMAANTCWSIIKKIMLMCTQCPSRVFSTVKAKSLWLRSTSNRKVWYHLSAWRIVWSLGAKKARSSKLKPRISKLRNPTKPTQLLTPFNTCSPISPILTSLVSQCRVDIWTPDQNLSSLWVRLVAKISWSSSTRRWSEQEKSIKSSKMRTDSTSWSWQRKQASFSLNWQKLRCRKLSETIPY